MDEVTRPDPPSVELAQLDISSEPFKFDLRQRLTSALSTTTSNAISTRPFRSPAESRSFKAVDLLCEQSPISNALVVEYARKLLLSAMRCFEPSSHGSFQ
jgi:hypothetical protein